MHRIAVRGRSRGRGGVGRVRLLIRRLTRARRRRQTLARPLGTSTVPGGPRIQPRRRNVIRLRRRPNCRALLIVICWRAAQTCSHRLVKVTRRRDQEAYGGRQTAGCRAEEAGPGRRQHLAFAAPSPRLQRQGMTPSGQSFKAAGLREWQNRLAKRFCKGSCAERSSGFATCNAQPMATRRRANGSASNGRRGSMARRSRAIGSGRLSPARVTRVGRDQAETR